jgi:hypothetical protein
MLNFVTDFCSNGLPQLELVNKASMENLSMSVSCLRPEERCLQVSQAEGEGKVKYQVGCPNF